MIRHHFRNGTTAEDVKGHLIRREDAPAIYKIIEQMEGGTNENEKEGRKTGETDLGRD